MKTIYLVSYYFAPLGRADGVNRTYLVKCLSELGWDVQVITGLKYRSLILNFQEDPFLLNILPPSVQIHRFESHRGWLCYDLKKIMGVARNLRNHWIKEAEKFSPKEKGVFLAIVPPLDNAFLAYKLAEKHGCLLALYYPDEVLEVPAHIVHRAEVIFCVTPEIKKSLEKHYTHPNIIVVEHGFADLAQLPPKDAVHLPLRLVYAGSFNFRTRPEWGAKAYHQLKQKYPSEANKIEIDYYGPDGYYFRLFLQRYLNDHIHFKGYLPFKKLMDVLPEYDMALTVNHADVAFPSKVYHYLNAGLPVFAVTEHPGLMDFIEKYDIGLVSGLAVDEIMRQLMILAVDKEHLLQWRGNILKVRHQFSLSTRMQVMHDALQALVF